MLMYQVCLFGKVAMFEFKGLKSLFVVMPHPCVGNELAPDYFLDAAEEFREKWVNVPKPASGTSPAGLFEKIKPLINSEIVQKIQATYRFAVTGDNPGENDMGLIVVLLTV